MKSDVTNEMQTYFIIHHDCLTSKTYKSKIITTDSERIIMQIFLLYHHMTLRFEHNAHAFSNKSVTKTTRIIGLMIKRCSKSNKMNHKKQDKAQILQW